MIRPHITRTFGPIHFEDLDPHRFEDLIRELIYDYKDWRSIEATGTSGSDDGFDIRAFEKSEIVSNSENDDGEEIIEAHPMEGNRWMIQVKREKKISPKKMENILDDVDDKNPPYGYILAASTIFSKKSYDIFRNSLLNKGVMEFYLWGKAELEDMLHLPKNDRILFTFFGISLVTKRKSRTTEVRSAVSIKNKLYKVLEGPSHQLNSLILIRNLNDTHYPFEDKSLDHKKNPRWKIFRADRHDPLGLWCRGARYFAYVDAEKKEWDYTREINLDSHHRPIDNDEFQRKNEYVHGVWDFFPRTNQGYLITYGLIKYADIVLVDDKGDSLYAFPHIYIDLMGKNSPFAFYSERLEINSDQMPLTSEFKQIKMFPDVFQKPDFNKIYKDRKVILPPKQLNSFLERFDINTLYEADGRYSYLEPRDVIPIQNRDQESKEIFIQITYKYKAQIKKVAKLVKDLENIKQQLERDVDMDEMINIYEFKRNYNGELTFL